MKFKFFRTKQVIKSLHLSSITIREADLSLVKPPLLQLPPKRGLETPVWKSRDSSEYKKMIQISNKTLKSGSSKLRKMRKPKNLTLNSESKRLKMVSEERSENGLKKSQLKCSSISKRPLKKDSTAK